MGYNGQVVLPLQLLVQWLIAMVNAIVEEIRQSGSATVQQCGAVQYSIRIVAGVAYTVYLQN